MPVFLLVSMILLLRADFLQIKSVEVTGNVSIQKEEVEKLVLEEISGQYFFVFPKSNYFFVKKEKLVQKILGDLSRTESVKINKNFNGILEISIKERQGDFVWCSTADNQTCYLMSKDGSVFVEAQPEEILAKIIFRGDLTTKNSIFSNYLKAIDILQNAKFEVYEVDVELGDKAVFKTDIGDIFLNPEEDLSISTPNAVILINEVRTKNPSAYFNYIDARFGNKVFYKLK